MAPRPTADDGGGGRTSPLPSGTASRGGSGGFSALDGSVAVTDDAAATNAGAADDKEAKTLKDKDAR
jgi:hypothetical protein